MISARNVLDRTDTSPTDSSVQESCDVGVVIAVCQPFQQCNRVVDGERLQMDNLEEAIERRHLARNVGK